MPGAYSVCLHLLPFAIPCNTILFGLKTNTIPTGEDALANLSIEKEGEDGAITGFVRIRSRSQGLALSLGSLKGLKATAA